MREKIEVQIDGVDTVLYVTKPTKRHEDKAKMVSNKAFREAVQNKCLFKSELNKELVERGILSESEKKAMEEGVAFLEESKNKLKRGGIELDEAKKIAVKMRNKRFELFAISVKLNEHEPFTVEGISDSAYFDALVSLCTLKEDGTQLFSSVDDYLDKAEEDYAVTAAKTLSGLLYGTSDDWQKELPENKFLMKYKFVNDDLEYVNKDGKLVDSEGRLINKEGRFINEAGEYINSDGNRVDESGEEIVEFSPFLENGTPVT